MILNHYNTSVSQTLPHPPIPLHTSTTITLACPTHPSHLDHQHDVAGDTDHATDTVHAQKPAVHGAGRARVHLRLHALPEQVRGYAGVQQPHLRNRWGKRMVQGSDDSGRGR